MDELQIKHVVKSKNIITHVEIDDKLYPVSTIINWSRDKVDSFDRSLAKIKIPTPKLPMWVNVLIGSGVILGIGQLFYHYSSDENNLTEFGFICRLIGGENLSCFVTGRVIFDTFNNLVIMI